MENLHPSSARKGRRRPFENFVREPTRKAMQSLRRSPRKARSSHHVELAPIEIPVALLASGGGVSSAPSGSIAKAPGATTVSVQLKARHIADDRSTRITKAKGKVGTRSSRGGATARDKVPSGRCMRHASDAGDTQRRDDDNKAVQSTSLPRARAPSESRGSLTRRPWGCATAAAIPCPRA